VRPTIVVFLMKSLILATGALSVSAAETDALDLHRRAGIGMAVVAADRAHVVEVLDAAERLVAARPEFELLSVKRRLHHSDDE